MIRITVVAALSALAAVSCITAARGWRWSELPPLPDPIGFAAPFAGVAQGRLVVAGGANFPAGRPWDGARKVWHDRVFVLDTPTGAWREAGRLPRPLGYGISISLPEGVLCLGGSDQHEHVRDAFVLRFGGDTLGVAPFPALPRPLANASGALVGTTIYVAGGIERPDGRPGRQFWALDLAAEPRAWRELAPCPGRPRMLSVAGAHGGRFYLFGGTDLVPDGAGGLKREYLRDAWSYDPGAGWKRLADLPAPRVAAPSPAPVTADGRLLVLGGDDGELAPRLNELRDNHPGFAPGILAYDPGADRWQPAGEMPRRPGPDPVNNPNGGVWPPVTVPVVSWNGGYVIPSGEVRPAVRTPRVLLAEPAR